MRRQSGHPHSAAIGRLRIEQSRARLNFLSEWVGQKNAGGETWFGRFSVGKFYMNCEVSIETRLLVIGYGNTLRGDDGVGPRVAEAVGHLRLPGVRTLICPLLTPELADPISRAETVIFVDAAVDGPNEVQWRKLEPNETSQLMAHAADPRTMLALARDVFGHVPEAWWLTIPALDLGFRETFSPEVQRGFAEAVEKIQVFCHWPQPN
jgi:hydrogenase maturation protease